MKIIINLVLILTLATSVLAADVSSLISQAEKHFANRNINSEVNVSISLFKQVLKLEPSNYTALWEISRAYFRLGEMAPQSKKLDFYKLSTDYALKATISNPRGCDGFFWYGSALGRRTELEGVIVAMQSVDKIRNALEKTVTLNPRFAPGHYALSILYRKAPGWPVSCGDIKKAEKHAKLAVAYGGNFTYTYIGLAEVYIDKKEYSLAKKALEQAMGIGVDPAAAQENVEFKAEAKRLLDKLP